MGGEIANDARPEPSRQPNGTDYCVKLPIKAKKTPETRRGRVEG